MKKFICFLTVLTVFASGIRADEGMWMLPLLEKMNGKALEEAGCRLSPDQIYSINHSSLKDAVIIADMPASSSSAVWTMTI